MKRWINLILLTGFWLISERIIRGNTNLGFTWDCSDMHWQHDSLYIDTTTNDTLWKLQYNAEFLYGGRVRLNGKVYSLNNVLKVYVDRDLMNYSRTGLKEDN